MGRVAVKRPDEGADGRAMLGSARRIARRLVDELEDDIDRLSERIGAEADPQTWKTLVSQMRELNRAMMTLLELESRLDDREGDLSEGALDLEAARAEIESRLDRLAAAGAHDVH